MTEISIEEYNYDLPAELIAQQPLPVRTQSRMMQVDRSTNQIHDCQFLNIIEKLQPNDLVVLNDTKVIPARLYGRKETGGQIECLIERVLNYNEVLAHLRSSKSPKPESRIVFSDDVTAVVMGRDDALFHLRFESEQTVYEILDRLGHMPLPPYITREDNVDDYERYQTVFAERLGAVAAPTASLHFDEALLNTLENKGVSFAKVTLHVGAGTFQPVRVNNIADHKMHKEWVDVSQSVVDAVENCHREGGRVIAIGTTVMRALETAARSGQLQPFQGDTDIFIYPGFQFHCVDGLLTNFHLPKSTLLMLVSAFAGKGLIFKTYEKAIALRYRFFSYGDAMFIL